MSVRFLMVALLSFLLAGCGKYEEREREVGFKGLAKVNRLLAAERLANEMGLKASSYAGAPSLPPAPRTTLMLPAASLQSEGQLGEMSDWVIEGGHLIVYLTLEGKEKAVWEAEEEELPFQACLDYFGLDVQAANTETEEKGLHVTLVRFTGDDYETDFETLYLISDNDLPDDDPRPLRSYNYGEGTLTVLASAQLFINDAIGEAEHATLLWDILAEGEEDQVWFIHSTRLSFFKLLWQRAPHAVILLLVTMFLLVWWASRGFGPKFVRGANPSAKLDEHLQASGAFFLKHRAEALVIEQLRGRLFRRLARALNQPFHLSGGELIRIAKEQGVLDASETAALMDLPTDKTLLPTLQTLKNLDKKL